MVNPRQKAEIHYHHFSLTLDPKELIGLFRDVQFALVAGCPRRVEAQGRHLANNLFNGEELPKQRLERLTNDNSRFILFKLGPVILANHGMGSASMSIALHEIFLMCQQASVIDKITLIRFGTCGGIGIPPGTICITKKSLDPLFREYIEIPICGRLVRRYSLIDQATAELLEELAIKHINPQDYEIKSGTTLGTNDFYEEQGRTNGAICEHSDEDKMRFLKSAHEIGVINMEMESNHLSAMAHKLKVKHGIIAVALNNRLVEDDIAVTNEQFRIFEHRLYLLISVFIRHKLMIK